tara:strand:- start:164 stop:451 length:288 start_codon:yes stop_codon:yes gene_type:complete
MNPTKRLNELEKEVMDITIRAHELETERNGLLKMQDCWGSGHYWEILDVVADFTTTSEVAIICQICGCESRLIQTAQNVFGPQSIPLGEMVSEEE